MKCVDLSVHFGDRYYVDREARGGTWNNTPTADRPWLLELRCRHGLVYPTGGNLLAAVVTGRYARRRIVALPCIGSRRGDTELVVTFDLADADAVLDILKPRRRPQVSAEERARRAARMQRLNQERRNAPLKSGRTQPGIDATAEGVLSPTPPVADAGKSPTPPSLMGADDDAPDGGDGGGPRGDDVGGEVDHRGGGDHGSDAGQHPRPAGQDPEPLSSESIADIFLSSSQPSALLAAIVTEIWKDGPPPMPPEEE